MGLFGFTPQAVQTGINARRQARPPQGPGEALMSIVPTGQAAIQNLDSGATMQQQAIDRLMTIGTDNARQTAQMIADNPQAAQFMIQQQGGWQQFAQREEAQAAFAQASQMGAAGATPGQMYQEMGLQGMDPQLAGMLAQQAQSLQPEGPSGADWQNVEIQDPNDPLGTMIYSRNRITGEMREIGAGKLPAGTDIRVGPDGTIIRTGRGIGGPGDDLEKKPRANLQESVIHSGERLQRLDEIAEKYNPELLTYWRQGQNWFDVGLDKAFPNNKARTDRIDEYKTFEKKVNEDLVPELRQMAGAAMTDVEIALLTKNLLTMDMSPQEFKTQLREIVASVRRKMLYESFILRRGLDWVSAGDAAYSPDLGMGKFKRMRGDRYTELQTQLRDRNPDATDEEIADQALEQLTSETQAGGMNW